MDGSTQVNRYDGEGLRHEMEENVRLVQFLFSGQEVVPQSKEDGDVIRYLRGYELIGSDSEQARTYYHYASDEMGSITHVVAGDSKEVLNEYRYDAFGNVVYERETVENRFRYAGQQYDGVTGQYYLRARYYNPVIGRFTQEDVYYGDGLNLYAYCRGNPVGYYDSSGYGKEKYQTIQEMKKTYGWGTQEALDYYRLFEGIDGAGQSAGVPVNQIEGLTQLSYESIMRALRQSGSVEGAAVAKLLKRGDFTFKIKDKFFDGTVGNYFPDSGNVIIYEQVKLPNGQWVYQSASSAAGFVTHEAKHWLDGGVKIKVDV